MRAAFDFYFEGTKKPRKVQVRPPNILKLGRHCDAAVVQKWLSEKRFRETVTAGERRHSAPLALAVLQTAGLALSPTEGEDNACQTCGSVWIIVYGLVWRAGALAKLAGRRVRHL